MKFIEFLKKLFRFIANAFQESDGSTSMARIGFFLLVCTALFVAIYQVIVTETHSFDNQNLLSLLGVATTLKLWQKGQENNLEIKLKP